MSRRSDTPPAAPAPPRDAAEREARLARALRDNLHRRKAQNRARAGAVPEGAAGETPVEAAGDAAGDAPGVPPGPCDRG